MNTTTEFRLCQVCKQELLVENFYKVRRGDRVSWGRRATCKRCYQSKQLERRKARQQGITYADAVLKFGSTCNICGKEETTRSRNQEATMPRNLCIDHNHLTGIVRGLLCNDCNTGISKFKDNPQWLRAAALYLEQRS